MGDSKDDAQAALRSLPDLRGVYHHRKGGVYTLYSVSVDEGTSSTMVHYYSPSRDSRWTRTLADFTEEVEGRPRFWKVRGANSEELLVATGLFGVR